MKKILWIIMGLGVLASMPGCATRRQVQELKLQIDTVLVEQAAIRAENARLDSLFRETIDQARRLDADFSSGMGQLDQKMSIVNARLDDAITLLNRAMGVMESRPVSRTVKPQASDTSSADTSTSTGGIDCQKLYNAAYFDVVKERYDTAIQGFNNYLQNCPQAALADKAQFWIGECYYLGKKYDRAQKAFEDMIQKYPNSDRIASAKLKLGESLYEQRQKTKARPYFEDVVKNYPGTEEADDAAKMLKQYR